MTQDKWISVDLRMPNIDCEDVLVCDKKGNIGIGFTFSTCALGDEENFVIHLTAYESFIDKKNITHWQPLPAPPGETP